MTTATSDWMNRNLILVGGKGGVGKTMVARAVAQHLASQGKRTLLCHVLQLEDHEQKLVNTAPNLWEVTLRSQECFKEYIVMKLRMKALYTAFLGNKITQYLERAAPGVREMVLLGKVWFERENYDHVVADMPSTGYALTMINTPFNFAELFPGGPIYRDANDMITTFSDPTKTAFVTVSLAEEMPLQESLEMAEVLYKLMPNNPSWLVINRRVHLSHKVKELHQNHAHSLTTEQQALALWQSIEHLIRREAKQNTAISRFTSEWQRFRKGWTEIDEVSANTDYARIRAIEEQIHG